MPGSVKAVNSSVGLGLGLRVYSDLNLGPSPENSNRQSLLLWFFAVLVAQSEPEELHPMAP